MGDVHTLSCAHIDIAPTVMCISNCPIDADKAPVVAMEGNAINEGRFVKSFKDLKKEGDTENNADSYAVFGAACDAAMARLRKRALMEGDHVRRSSSSISSFQ